MVSRGFSNYQKRKTHVSLLRFKPILYCFGEVFGEDMVGGFEVGDGSGELDEAVVGAGGEAHGGNSLLQETLGGAVEWAGFSNESGSHFGIGEYAFLSESFALYSTGFFNAFSDSEA